jgi:hypothetical protein
MPRGPRGRASRCGPSWLHARGSEPGRRPGPGPRVEAGPGGRSSGLAAPRAPVPVLGAATTADPVGRSPGHRGHAGRGRLAQGYSVPSTARPAPIGGIVHGTGSTTATAPRPIRLPRRGDDRHANRDRGPAPNRRPAACAGAPVSRSRPDRATPGPSPSAPMDAGEGPYGHKATAAVTRSGRPSRPHAGPGSRPAPTRPPTGARSCRGRQ